MTLYGHFALKSVLGWPCYGFTCSGLGTKQSGNLQSYTHTVIGKSVAQRLDCTCRFWRCGYTLRFLVEGASNRRTESRLSHVLFTEVYKIIIYKANCCCLKSQHMFDVGSRQKMTDMDTKINGLQSIDQSINHNALVAGLSSRLDSEQVHVRLESISTE